MRVLYGSACFATFLAIGCGGPPVTGLESSEVNISLFAVASAPDVAGIGNGSEEGGLSVHRAFIATSSMTLVPCNEDAAEIKLKPGAYDLLAPPLVGETVNTAVNELCALKLALAPLGSDAPEGAPENAATLIDAENESGEALELIGENPDTVVLEAVDGVSFGPLPLLLTFDVSIWLDGVSHEPDMTDEASEVMAAQTALAMTLYEDTNGDYRLDDDEKTPIAVVR